MRSFCAATLLVLCFAAAPARAQGEAPAPSSGLTTSETYANPRPSNLLPRSIFDPSRLSISNSMVFGYSSGGGGFAPGTAGLFTSSLGYRISGNTALRVDVGAHMNPVFGGGTEKGIFLQSAAFDWRPSRNSLFRVEYRDMRSPLQPGAGYAGYGNGYANGYGGPGGWEMPYGTNAGPGPTGLERPGELLPN